MTTDYRNPTTKELLERRKERLFKGEHLLRHAISSMFAILVCVAVELVLTHNIKQAIPKKYPEPVIETHPLRRVLWTDMGRGLTGPPDQIPEVTDTNAVIVFGAAEDGTVVWKLVHKQ